MHALTSVSEKETAFASAENPPKNKAE